MTRNVPFEVPEGSVLFALDGGWFAVRHHQLGELVELRDHDGKVRGYLRSDRAGERWRLYGPSADIDRRMYAALDEAATLLAANPPSRSAA